MGDCKGQNLSSNTTSVTNETKPVIAHPGPLTHGKETQVILFNRAQIIASGLLPSLTTLINNSFNSVLASLLGGRDRLQNDGQYVEELGHHPETFVCIIRAIDSGDLIATAYASRYQGVTEWPEGPGERTWERLGVPEEGTQAWELHMMAVSPDYQKQGLAEHLMRVFDAEITHRVDGKSKNLVLYISTIKEMNGRFYLRRGFRENYSVAWPIGHLGSKMEFTIVHMDREIKLDEEQR